MASEACDSGFDTLQREPDALERGAWLMMARKGVDT